MDRIVSLQHLSGLGITCIVLEGGDIITVQETLSSGGDGDGVVEIVGSLDADITAAKWSPDEELLLVTTKSNVALFMSATFDPVAEVSLTAEDLKASKHVSVGWGKKETQFQGRGAKALRDPTIPEKVDEGLPSTFEDGAATISWRGDGAFVALNSVQDGSRRVVRVFSRKGELESASEPVDGLEGALSWRPSGNLIAGIQRLSERVDVVFFERNGLRHGQFTLRSPGRSLAPEQRIRLDWNSDSTVLAVTLEDCVQLWTSGNYHWYLKREIPIPHGICSLSWHPEKALRFAAASTSGVTFVEEIFHTARGSCLPPHDNGAVAVIDGDTVKLTPFRMANAPPPMSLFDVLAGSPVVDMAFGRHNAHFTVLHHRGVDVYEWPVVKGRSGKPKLVGSLPLADSGLIPLRIWCLSKYQYQLVCARGDSSFAHFTVTMDSNSLSPVDIGKPLVSTSAYEDVETLESYGQDTSGRLYKFSNGTSEDLFIQFPTHCPWFEVSRADEQLVAFGLSRSGHMYANSRLLSKNCTSFVVTPSHLIFTTSNHFIKFVHLVSAVAGECSACSVRPSEPQTDSVGRTRGPGG